MDIDALLRQVGERRYERQVVEAERVSAASPDNPEYRAELAEGLESAREYERAFREFKVAERLAPRQLDYGVGAARMLRLLGRTSLAIKRCRGLLKSIPSALVYCELASSQLDSGDHDGAVDSLNAALALDPPDAPTWRWLDLLFMKCGLLDQALVCWKRARDLDPSQVELQSNLLPQHYRIADPAVLLQAHRTWAAQHRSHIGPATHRLQPRRPGTPIRIGYVSGDFWHHVVMRYFEPLLEHHDAERFEVFCYDNSGRADMVTHRLRRWPSEWRFIDGIGDEDLVRLIRHDDIDVLVDLSGHSARNRLGVFARRAAPVQVAWLGYLGTSGLTEMDYRVTDLEADPPGAERYYTEKLLRLPCQWSYRPFEDAPAIISRLAGEASILFGSLNNYLKVTPEALDLWAEVLNSVADSRMMIVGVPKSSVEDLLRTFAVQGVDPCRIEAVGRTTYPAYMQLFSRIDIALDTCPYTGGATTCESLWMGVPVVTLAGICGFQRTGASILAAVGLHELVADSRQSYVRIASELAGDRARVANLRSGLRGRMRGSRLMDEAGFARNFEAALESVIAATDGDVDHVS